MDFEEARVLLRAIEGGEHRILAYKRYALGERLSDEDAVERVFVKFGQGAKTAAEFESRAREFRAGSRTFPPQQRQLRP